MTSEDFFNKTKYTNSYYYVTLITLQYMVPESIKCMACMYSTVHVACNDCAEIMRSA